MRRSHWVFLLSAVVLGLAPCFALAQSYNGTYFQATEISTLQAGFTASGGTSATATSVAGGGLIELQNTGLVITNLAGSQYVEYQPGGGSIIYNGFQAVLNAVLDGRDGGSWQGTQGITGVNAANNPTIIQNYGPAYTIAFDYLNNTALNGWGGIQFSTSDQQTNPASYVDNGVSYTNQPLGDMLIRETLAGDANLDGTVDPYNDLLRWQNNSGNGASGNPSPYLNTSQAGPAAGDFAYFDATTSGGIDPYNDLLAWQNNANQSLNDQNDSLGPIAGPVAGGVEAVPEPGTLALLFAAALSLLVFARSSLRRFCGAVSVIFSTRFFGGTKAMRKVLVVSALLGVVMLLAATANAELVYFLRPVTGDAANINAHGDNGSGYNNGAGSGYVEGDYTINGNGTTTAFSVTINTLPAAGTVADISFQLYAAMATPAGKSYFQEGIVNAAPVIENTPASTALVLTPDVQTVTPVAATDPFGGVALKCASIGTAQLNSSNVNNWGVLSGPNSAPTTTNLVFNTGQAPYEYPSRTATSLSSAGNSAANIPSEFTLGSSTLGMALIADIGFQYGSSLTSGGSTTLMVVSYTTTGSGSYTPAVWYDGCTLTKANMTTASPSGGTINNWTGTNSGAKSVLSSLSEWGGVASTGVTITYGQPASVVAGVVNITSGPTLGSSSVFTNGTTTVTGVLTNSVTASSGASGQDSVNWSVAASALNGTLSPTSSGGLGLAPGISTGTLSFTYSAGSTFGVDTIKLTPSGTNATLTGAAGTTSRAQTATINVIGVGSGATDYGTTFTSMNIPAGSSFGSSTTPLQTQVSSSGTAGIGSTIAQILAGSNSGSTGTTVTMTWRATSAGETAGIYGHPLFSDVVNLTGGNSSSPYVLSMSFGSAAVLAANPDYPTIAAAAAAGQIYIGHNYGTTPGGGAGTSWSNYGSNAGPYNVESYATWLNSNPAAATSLLPFVGDWGVDPNTDTAWVILAGGTTGEFAVVPEPGTLALLAAGAISLAIAYRRRKAAKA